MTVLSPCKPPLLASNLRCSMVVSNWIGSLAMVTFELVVRTQNISYSLHCVFFTQVSGLVLMWGQCNEFLKNNRIKIDSLVKGYRQLQVKEKMHNSSYKGRILPVCALGVPFIQILSGFALTALFGKASPFVTSIFLVLYLDAVGLGLTVLTATSIINVKSGEWVNNLRSRVVGKDIYFRRVQLSFRPLRLEFGNNFVDRLTPLVIQEFCSRQTASLLVLNRS